MSKRPYRKSSREWLESHETAFRDVLHAASHLETCLRNLEKTFGPQGNHMLDFLDVSQSELEKTYITCRKIMMGLAPTVQEMRKELEIRATDAAQH